MINMSLWLVVMVIYDKIIWISYEKFVTWSLDKVEILLNEMHKVLLCIFFYGNIDNSY